MSAPTVLAWLVHAFTASGAVLGVLGLQASGRGDFDTAAIWMLVALAIDAVDGSLARRARVEQRVPSIDGRRLDDVVDYLTYVVVPVLFLSALGVLAHWSLGALMAIASAYGFAQRDAKTKDDFFLGWPSYWNVFALYAWMLELGPAATAAWIVVLAAAIPVPLKYVYPSKLRRCRGVTLAGGGVWICVMAAAVWFPDAVARLHGVALSLLFPLWYIALSAWLGRWLRPAKRDAAGR